MSFSGRLSNLFCGSAVELCATSVGVDTSVHEDGDLGNEFEWVVTRPLAGATIVDEIVIHRPLELGRLVVLELGVRLYEILGADLIIHDLLLSVIFESECSVLVHGLPKPAI